MPSWALDSPERLAALDEVDVFPGVADEAFAVYTRLIARLLEVPTALVSFVADDRQFFPAAVGLGEPWASRGETPLSMSFCQHVVRGDQAFIVTDAKNDERVKAMVEAEGLDLQAYLGVPMRAPGGEPLGSLCAVDTKPRAWTDTDLAVLQDLAEAVAATISLRVSEHRRAKLASEASHQLRTPLARLQFELDDLTHAVRDVDGVRDGLQAAAGHLDELATTVGDLLTLAQQGPLQRSEIDVLALAYVVAAQRIAGGTDEPGSVVIEGESATVHSSRAVLHHVIDRLLHAAEASDDAPVTVYVSADANAARIDISAAHAPVDSRDVAVARRLLTTLRGRLVTNPSPAVAYQVVLPVSVD